MTIHAGSLNNMSLQLLPLISVTMAAFLRGRVINSIVHGYQLPVIRALNIRLLSDKAVDWPSSEPPIPEYKSPENEPTARKRARLLYQSR